MIKELTSHNMCYVNYKNNYNYYIIHIMPCPFLVRIDAGRILAIPM